MNEQTLQQLSDLDVLLLSFAVDQLVQDKNSIHRDYENSLDQLAYLDVLFDNEYRRRGLNHAVKCRSVLSGLGDNYDYDEDEMT